MKKKWLVIGAILMIFVFMISGCSKKSSDLVLTGTIESTEINVNSEVTGRIISLVKDEGSIVKKDDVLAVVDSSLYEFTVKQAEAVVKIKQAKLDELTAGSRVELISQQSSMVDNYTAAFESAKVAFDNAQVNYNYWLDKYNSTEKLHQADAVSESDLKDAKYKLDTAEKQMLTAESQKNTSSSMLDASMAQLRLLKNGNISQVIKAAKADLEQAQVMLAQTSFIKEKYNIKAPVDGTYILRNLNIGDMVNQGTSIGVLSDLNDLWIKVYIPQGKLDLVKLNQQVNLKTAANKIIKGQVIYIANESEFTPKNTETAEAKENTVFKIKIKILEDQANLKPGMTLNAYIPVGGR